MSSSSFDLPTDLVKQILLNLPIKTLVRFKAVSMEWNDLISDPFFRAMRYCSVLKVPSKSMNKNSIGTLVTFVNYSRNASITCPVDLWSADDPRLPKDYKDIFSKLSGDNDHDGADSDDDGADSDEDDGDEDEGADDGDEEEQLHAIRRILGPYHGVYLVHDLFDNAVMWNHATNEYKLLSKGKEYAQDSWFLFGSYELAEGVVDFQVMRIYYGESRRVPRLFKSSIGKWKDLKPIPKDCSCMFISAMTVSFNGVFYWSDGEVQLPYFFYFDTRTETYGKLKFPNDIPKQEFSILQPTCYTENGIKFPSFRIVYKDKFDLWVKEEESWIMKASVPHVKFIESRRHKILVDTKADEWFSILTYQESLFGFRCTKKTSLKTQRKFTKKMARLSLKDKS